MAKQLGSCIGFSLNSNSSYATNCIHQEADFQIFLDRLNGGYEVNMALMRSMKGYRNLKKQQAEGLLTYVRDSIGHLEDLSSTFNYGTTKTAQRLTYEMLEKEADTEKEFCNFIQTVINRHKQNTRRMYPGVRLGKDHPHCQANSLKRQFAKVHKPLQKVANELEKLHTEEEQLIYGSQEISDSKIAGKLKKVQGAIDAADKKRKGLETNYNKETMAILQRCQALEKERLDQIKQTTVEFIRAIHPPAKSPKVLQNFNDFLSNITITQNSTQDIEEWARIRSYDIPMPSATNENVSIATVDDHEQQSTTDV